MERVEAACPFSSIPVIYRTTLRDLSRCGDRIRLNEAQSGIAKCALELFARVHGDDEACRGILRQLAMTRKQYRAYCG